MGRNQKLYWLLVLILALSLLPATPTAAAESGSLWFCSSAAEDSVVVSLCADAAVASGVITVTYDARALTFSELTVDSNYVLAHAVNAKISGKVQISWIAPADLSAEDCQVLMQLHFKGTTADSIGISGSANSPSGEAVSVAALDFTAINTALEEAEWKLVQDYTPSSFDAMLTAEKEARELLKQAIITPAQLSAATEKLETALEQLELKAPPTQPPTQPPTAPPTVPATQQTPAPTPTPQEGNDGFGIAAVIVAICAAVVVTVVIILKKRRNK